MRKMQRTIVKGKDIFVGLEDSKRTWKLCIRCEGMIIHETGIPADYSNLQSYLKSRYPGCRIQVMYDDLQPTHRLGSCCFADNMFRTRWLRYNVTSNEN